MENLSAGAKAAIIIGSLVTLAAIGYGVYYFRKSAPALKNEESPVIDKPTESNQPAPIVVIADKTGINKDSFNRTKAPEIPLKKRRGIIS